MTKNSLLVVSHLFREKNWLLFHDVLCREDIRSSIDNPKNNFVEPNKGPDGESYPESHAEDRPAKFSNFLKPSRWFLSKLPILLSWVWIHFVLRQGSPIYECASNTGLRYCGFPENLVNFILHAKNLII